MYGGKITEAVANALNEYEDKFGVMYALMEVDFETDKELIADIKHHIDIGVAKVYNSSVGEI